MKIETAFDLNEKVQITANGNTGKVVGFWLGYQHSELLYNVEYTDKNGAMFDRYFQAGELVKA